MHTQVVEVGLNVGGDAFTAPDLAGLCQRYGVHLDTGSVIVREQDRTTDLYFLVGGLVEFSIEGPQGQRRVLSRAGRGMLFGEVSCFGGLPRSATATALDDCFILKFDRETALQLVGTSPRFALRIIQTLSERLRVATTRPDDPPPPRERTTTGSRRPLAMPEALRI